MKHPSSTQRSECWQKRDEYFTCLNANDLFLYGLNLESYQEILRLDPLNLPVISSTGGSCFKELQNFKDSCLDSWVKHFEMLRVKELQEKVLKEKVESDQVLKDSDPFWEKVQKKE